VAKRDYYEVLGVPKNAQKDDIKKAYRKLAIQFHPDKNQGDKKLEERFKEASEAYEVLSSEQKRAAYDQFGFAGVEGMAGGGPQDYSNVFHDFEDIFGDFSGIFDSFFGGARRSQGQSRGGAARGSNLRYDLELPFEQAAFGASVEIQFPKNESCASCKGSGSQDGSGRKVCPSCQGSGQVRRSSGFFSIASPCSACRGEGAVIEHPCHECGGSGLVKKRQKIKVTIPAGIEDGRRVTIPGQGDSGPNGGPAGDLYVFIRVLPHDVYERDGADLYCAVPISMTQAALGAEIAITTIEGKKVKVSVPSGSSHGKVLRLREEGVPTQGGRRGDLYLKIVVAMPAKLSKRSRELLEEVSRIEGEEPNPKPMRLDEYKRMH
jgi:molecular chaperone DnaJ